MRFAPSIDKDRVVVDKYLDLCERPTWDLNLSNFTGPRNTLTTVF